MNEAALIEMGEYLRNIKIPDVSDNTNFWLIRNRYKETAAFFASVGDKIKGEDLEEILPELEKEAGEKIDFLFGAPVSENFFEITHPFTILEDGQTFAEQIITVIGGIIEKELAEREKKQQERIEKYIAKYTKKDEAD